MLEPGTLITLIVAKDDNGLRIDTVISKMIGCSRTLIQEFIALGLITIDTKIVKKSSMPVISGQEVVVAVPKLNEAYQSNVHGESMLDAVVLCAEQDDFIIINKPAGLVVHAPNRKSREPSLVDWLSSRGYLNGFEGLCPRPGIVHRLDKETSGIMVIAKNRIAHGILSDLFKARKVQKKYYAVVHGTFFDQMYVDNFLIRDPVSHIKMTSVEYSYHHDNVAQKAGFKRAISDIKKIKQFLAHSLIEVTPLTGRTHQIRVHCATLGYPLVGDALYGKKSELIGRHALHAYSLSFEYKGKNFHYEVPLATDIDQLLLRLS